MNKWQIIMGEKLGEQFLYWQENKIALSLVKWVNGRMNKIEPS